MKINNKEKRNREFTWFLKFCIQHKVNWEEGFYFFDKILSIHHDGATFDSFCKNAGINPRSIIKFFARHREKLSVEDYEIFIEIFGPYARSLLETPGRNEEAIVKFIQLFKEYQLGTEDLLRDKELIDKCKEDLKKYGPSFAIGRMLDTFLSSLQEGLVLHKEIKDKATYLMQQFSRIACGLYMFWDCNDSY